MAGIIKSEDTESEAGSISEEERIRKLFQACDGDGDGFIDSEDLLSICRELNLEQCVGELMQELGADEHGRISYQGFLRRRLELAGQVEAATRHLGRGTVTETEEETEEEEEGEGGSRVRRRKGVCGECGAHQELCSREEARESSGDSGFRRTLVVIDSNIPSRQQEYRQPTSSENSLGAGSGGRQERWEFDSGARDLSPEPQAPPQRGQQQVPGGVSGGAQGPQTQNPSGVNTNSPIPPGGTASLLDMANKLHQAALASLKGEIQDLTGQLKAVTQERDFLERSLSKAQLEKLRLVHDAEERLDSQAQRYEGRLTELHCVIAELSRKIRGRTSCVITEEEEEVDDDDSTTAAEEDDEEEDEELDEEDGAGSQSVAADTTQDDLSGVGGEEGLETETHDCCELESGRTELVDGEGTVVPDDATDHTQTQDLVSADVRREEEDDLEQQRRLHRKVKELQGNLQQLQIITPAVTSSRNDMAPLSPHGNPDYHGFRMQERPPCCIATHAPERLRHSPRRPSPDRGGMVDRWVGTVGAAASTHPPSVTHSVPPKFNPPPPPPIQRAEDKETPHCPHVVEGCGNITASEMVNLGVCCNSRTAEHLVRDIREESYAQELNLAAGCVSVPESSPAALWASVQNQWKGKECPGQSCVTRLPMETLEQNVGANRDISPPKCGCLPVLRALELEVERQAGRAEAHRANAELVTLSLEECRSACEQQALVLGRRGSDIVGLATAISYALPLCHACFILSRLLNAHSKKGVNNEDVSRVIPSSCAGKSDQIKLKSRIPEFQMKNADLKGSRSAKKRDEPVCGGSGRSTVEPEKSWLCRKREELGRSWGNRRMESEEKVLFVDEGGGYGKINRNCSSSSSDEKRNEETGSSSPSSSGASMRGSRADVGCGGIDSSDVMRLVEMDAVTLLESLDSLLSKDEGRDGEVILNEDDWVLSREDFHWLESLGKEEDGSPDIQKRLGKHISTLFKSLLSCGVGLKKAKAMATEASSSEGDLGLPASNSEAELALPVGQCSSKADLEVAVLMQELMAMREERAVLRTKIHALEGEREELGRVCMLLKLGRGEEAADVAGGSVMPHIPSTKDLIRLVEESGRVTGSIEGSSDRLGDMADNREQWLERRLQELALTLEQVATSADLRLRQSTAVMNDLRRTNGALAHSFDRCRRRYQQRLKTLETNMENLVDRHASQVRTLRQRINQLEDRDGDGPARDKACKVGHNGGRMEEVSL